MLFQSPVHTAGSREGFRSSDQCGKTPGQPEVQSLGEDAGDCSLRQRPGFCGGFYLTGHLPTRLDFSMLSLTHHNTHTHTHTHTCTHAHQHTRRTHKRARNATAEHEGKDKTKSYFGGGGEYADVSHTDRSGLSFLL